VDHGQSAHRGHDLEFIISTSCKTQGVEVSLPISVNVYLASNGPALSNQEQQSHKYYNAACISKLPGMVQQLACTAHALHTYCSCIAHELQLHCTRTAVALHTNCSCIAHELQLHCTCTAVALQTFTSATPSSP
jgi:hypothetical protein